jgi:predicted DNA-binding protein
MVGGFLGFICRPDYAVCETSTRLFLQPVLVSSTCSRMPRNDTIPKPLRISRELESEVKRVSKKVAMPEAEVMRKSMEHGLGVFEKLLASPLRKRLKPTT